MSERKPASGTRRWLRLIAFAKLFKAAGLIMIGIVALRMSTTAETDAVHRVGATTGLQPGSHLIHEALARVSGLSAHQLREIGVGTFLYATLFLIEGVGLLAQKRWAEYFSIIITGSFIPVELYEAFERFTVLRVLAIPLNVAAVAYLVYHIRHTPSHKQAVAKAREADLSTR